MDFEKSGIRKNQKKEEVKQKINMFLARYFNWLLILIVLTVIIAGSFFILKPKYDYINKLKMDNEFGQEQEYSSRRQYLDEIKSLIEAYNKVSPSDIEKIDVILSEKDVPEELFSQIESLTKGNGLLLESLKIESAGEVEKPSNINLTKKIQDNIVLPAEIGKIKATLNVVGVDYFSLKSLVSSFENSLMVMDIINLDFNPDNNSAELIFYAYYLKKAN